jgi:hypothetical protein
MMGVMIASVVLCHVNLMLPASLNVTNTKAAVLLVNAAQVRNMEE